MPRRRNVRHYPCLRRGCLDTPQRHRLPSAVLDCRQTLPSHAEDAMTTRRDFLTITVVGAAAAALTPARAGAAPKSMTVARESSFIKPFDDYFSQTLAAEY